MKVIGCRDIGIDCAWQTSGELDDVLLHELAQHAIDVHKVWPEDGPIQTWQETPKGIREVDEPPSSQTDGQRH